MRATGIVILSLLCMSAVLSVQAQSSEQRLHALIQDYLLLSQATHARNVGDSCTFAGRSGRWIRHQWKGKKSWVCHTGKLMHLSKHTRAGDLMRDYADFVDRTTGKRFGNRCTVDGKEGRWYPKIGLYGPSEVLECRTSYRMHLSVDSNLPAGFE